MAEQLLDRKQARAGLRTVVSAHESLSFERGVSFM